MADEKKASDGAVSLLNKSSRKFTSVKDGKSFDHMSGRVETYTAEEAAALAGYKELLDTSKLPGSLNAAQLKKENSDLLAANKALQAQLDALKPKEEKPKDEKPAAPSKK